MQDRDDGSPRVALVTGASRGLGMAVARELAMRSWSVIATARTEGGLVDLDDQLRDHGRQASLAPLDLTDSTGVTRLGEVIAERWGRLDLLAHCAAVPAAASPIVHVDPAELRTLLEGNVLATQRVISVADPLLRKSAQSIAVFTLDSAFGAYRGAYGAAKAGVEALAKAYFEESRRGPVLVVGVQPPPMATSLRARTHPGTDSRLLANPALIAQRMIHVLQDSEAEWRNSTEMPLLGVDIFA